MDSSSRPAVAPCPTPPRPAAASPGLPRAVARRWARSGRPATPSTFTVDSLSDGSLQLLRGIGPLNSEQLPAYHRLDFRVSRNFPIGGGVLQAYLDVFNVYNRTNLRSYFYFPELDANNQVVVVRGSGEDLLPILPSLGFRYEF